VLAAVRHQLYRQKADHQGGDNTEQDPTHRNHLVTGPMLIIAGSEDVGLGDLERIGSLVPGREAGILVMHVVPFIGREDRDHQVLHRALDLLCGDVEPGQRCHPEQPARVEVGPDRCLLLRKPRSKSSRLRRRRSARSRWSASAPPLSFFAIVPLDM